MKTWWANLNLREQVILAVAGLIAIVIIMDSLVIGEYRQKYNQLEEQLEQANDDLNWMKQAVHRIPSQQTRKNKILSGRVVTYIDQQITRLGLKKQMQQMTPIKDHSVRIRLSDINFDNLLKFFTTIEGAVTIVEVRILPSEKVGFVNASLVVSTGKSSS